MPTHFFKPSKYQHELFDWVENGKGSAIIEAVAGSGKTTTIVQALNLIPNNDRAIFLAFNKAIADELKNRVPKNTAASTFHSAGLRSWMRIHKGCIIDDNKIDRILKRSIPKPKHNKKEKGYDMVDTVSHIVGLAKQRGIGILVENIRQEWIDIIDHFDIDIDWELVDDIINMSSYILNESIRISDNMIDFNDMIYMPVLKKTPIDMYDWVFIDEAQDTNGVRRALAGMMLKRDGRLVAVGDSHQAIYGFTGADSDAISLIQERFDCQIFPLSICYRSAYRIVQEAKKFVPNIEPSDDAPEGIVSHTDFEKTIPQKGDAILCRNTAPLVNLAYEFISQGIGCKILGRDIGVGLINLIKKMKADNITDLYKKLSSYRSSEIDRFMEDGKENRAQSVNDKVECIFTIMSMLNDNDRNIDGLFNSINKIFQSNGGDVLTLSTIHKAKGLEWDRVFIYMPELMPSKYARKDWQIKQEVNIQYVSVTRAKKELYFVQGDPSNTDINKRLPVNVDIQEQPKKKVILDPVTMTFKEE